jgi:hypothetical protein
LESEQNQQGPSGLHFGLRGGSRTAARRGRGGILRRNQGNTAISRKPRGKGTIRKPHIEKFVEIMGFYYNELYGKVHLEPKRSQEIWNDIISNVNQVDPMVERDQAYWTQVIFTI